MVRVGLDPGTSKLRVVLRGRGVVLEEPAVLLVDRASGRVQADGGAAGSRDGRAPAHLRAVRPLRHGRIEDFDACRHLFRRVLRRAVGWRWELRPAVAAGVPATLTDFERRAMEEVLGRAGAGRVDLVDLPLAAARGAGVALESPEGTMVLDLGAASTEVGIVSLRTLAARRTVPIGGNHLDEALVRHLRRRHDLEVGPRHAEALKKTLGSAAPRPHLREGRVHGRDLATGRLRSVVLTAEEVRQVLLEPLGDIARAARAVAMEAPPVLAEDLVGHGVVLTGGGARLPGLDSFLQERLGLPVRVAEGPETCVALGTLE